MDEIKGLTKEEIESRIRKKETNKVKAKTGRSVFQIIFSNIFTYFNLIFTILALFVISAGAYKQLLFMVVVIANMIIGIVQELQSKAVLDKMSLLNAPKSKVIRDGNEIVIPSNEIVLGEYMKLVAGDQIPADATVIDGKVSVNESLLTGEQDEIAKNKDDKLMSGSFIVSGECIAVATAVGNNSYIAKLSVEAKKMDKKQRSEMVKSVDLIVKIAGVVIIPVGILLFYQNFIVNKFSYSTSVSSMVAAVVGMIPEGLYLLLTLALATGAIRLAKEKVLLHEMKSIESLARVDVFCVDKTGTITEQSMAVDNMMAVVDESEFEKKLYQYVSFSTDNNSTMKALKDYFQIKKYDLIDKKLLNVYPFSSKYKLGAIEYSNEILVLGAPEFVLKDRVKNYSENIDLILEKGYRVLVFASQKDKFSFEEDCADREVLGFVVLSNAIRENAKDTFKYFKEQDVAIKVISGDNPKTVSEVALKAGIDNAEKFVDANTLNTDEEVAEAVDKYTVFGRVTPEQKRRIVLALKEKGHTVAMTGDGVNDILAMKSADCSVAMASGSEAAAQSAQLVLLDSDFGHMPSVVAEGRRVVNNIKRSATLFLVKNIFSFLLALISIMLYIKYPFTPSHIMLISLFTIGLPGMLIAFEPNNNRIEGKFIKDVMVNALPSGITDAIIIATISIGGTILALDSNYIGTAAIIIMAVVGFMILRKISLPFTRHRFVSFLICIIGMIVTAFVMPNMFDLRELNDVTILLVIIFSFAAESLFRNLSILISFIMKYKELKKEKEI